MAGLELEECPECGDPLVLFGSPTPMPSGFTDQVVVCACEWVGVRSEIRDEPVQMKMELEVEHLECKPK